ncbi:MAG TPA: hypothetical protein VLK84_06085, partial [Longimicrobium sp.]|nr:hypothetical protein [Longimicrobium sp.]
MIIRFAPRECAGRSVGPTAEGMVREPIHDDERLAALLDGRLTGEEREELLAYLSVADEEYQILAGTAAILLAVEEEAEEAMVSPPTRELRPPSRVAKGGWRRRSPRWVATVAALTGLIVLGTLRTAPTHPAVRLAERLDDGRELDEHRETHTFQTSAIETLNQWKKSAEEAGA